MKQTKLIASNQITDEIGSNQIKSDQVGSNWFKVESMRTMKGLDTVESLSAEASDNLSTNSFCMMKTIFTALGFTKTRALV